MQSTYYYQNISRDRKHLIATILRDWPALRTGLRNGRSLTRLSTKQLVAKLKAIHRAITAQREKYLTRLDTIQASVDDAAMAKRLQYNPYVGVA